MDEQHVEGAIATAPSQVPTIVSEVPVSLTTIEPRGFSTLGILERVASWFKRLQIGFSISVETPDSDLVGGQLIINRPKQPKQ
jgi:hypothetical protein